MSFGAAPPQPQYIPTAPAPPPNPPMFGGSPQRKPGQSPSGQQFNASVLGSLPPQGQSAQKTLLGS